MPVNKIQHLVFFDNCLVQARFKIPDPALALTNHGLAFYAAALLTTPSGQERVAFITALTQGSQILPITIVAHKLEPVAGTPSNWSDELQSYIKDWCARAQINNHGVLPLSFLLHLQKELVRLQAQPIIIPKGLPFSVNL